MIAYHGSTAEIRFPDLEHSKDFLDFGRGFYMTTYKDQAEKWAKRKATRTEKTPVVNQYEVPEHWGNLKLCRFSETNEEWLDFVCACRNGSEEYKTFDVIIGPVANDDVFKTVDMYLRGIWNKDRALAELRFYKKNDQICLVSQKAIEMISFQKAYDLEI